MDRLIRELRCLLQALDNNSLSKNVEAMLQLNKRVNKWLDRAEQYPASTELVSLFKLLREKYETKLDHMRAEITRMKAVRGGTAQWLYEISNAG